MTNEEMYCQYGCADRRWMKRKFRKDMIVQRKKTKGYRKYIRKCRNTA